MSLEINLCRVPLKNNGSVEPQPPLPRHQGYPVQPIPPSFATQMLVNTAEMVQPNEVEKPPTTDKLRAAAMKNWFEEMRGSIMVVAILVASITYTSGLNPPGGCWQDDDDGHEAGRAIMHYKSPRRYRIFLYANATAFMASLVTIILLMIEKFYSKKSKVVILNINMVLGLISLIISYAAGTARTVFSSIYITVLAVVVLLFVVCSERFLAYMFNFLGRY